MIGCGVVGAAIAYELSRLPGLQVLVLDRQPPAQAATGAALGIMMGVISHKLRGRGWQMRLDSLRRYETLIPELQALTDLNIPYNREGILQVFWDDGEVAAGEELAMTRRAQGLQLEILSPQQVRTRYPYLGGEHLCGALYSPQDRQVHPTALTQALVAAAKHHGADFQFGTVAQGWGEVVLPSAQGPGREAQTLLTSVGAIQGDWFVIASGLGSTDLTAALGEPVTLQPVLGQATHVRLKHPLGHSLPQPVFTTDDVHLVPLGESDYWVGATVEFPPQQSDDWTDWAAVQAALQPSSASFQQIWGKAIALCPALTEATTIRHWSGLRPRPVGRSAPVIGRLPGFHNVLLATGHYRNGVFLAPATAQQVCQLIRA